MQMVATQDWLFVNIFNIGFWHCNFVILDFTPLFSLVGSGIISTPILIKVWTIYSGIISTPILIKVWTIYRYVTVSKDYFSNKKFIEIYKCAFFWVRIKAMVFNATFNNISAISCRSVLLVEENEVPRENHQSVASPDKLPFFYPLVHLKYYILSIDSIDDVLFWLFCVKAIEPTLMPLISIGHVWRLKRNCNISHCLQFRTR